MADQNALMVEHFDDEDDDDVDFDDGGYIWSYYIINVDWKDVFFLIFVADQDAHLVDHFDDDDG